MAYTHFIEPEAGPTPELPGIKWAAFSITDGQVVFRREVHTDLIMKTPVCQVLLSATLELMVLSA